MRCEQQDRIGLLAAMAGWAARLADWQERARGRRALMALPDRSLKDLGISRCEAWAEFDRPFWRGEPWNRKAH